MSSLSYSRPPRLSTSSDVTAVGTGAGRLGSSVSGDGANGRGALGVPPTPPIGSNQPGHYHISSVVHDGLASSTLGSTATGLPSLASNPYLPASIASLGTTFTSAGTLPKASATSKPVAQRRSQAPAIVLAGAELRPVVMSEFETYLREVAPAWERWQQESRLGRDGTADLGNSAPTNAAAGGTDSGIGLGIGDAERPVAIVTPRLGKEEPLPPLDQVPQIFFDPAFNLSNPRTFDLVTERIQLSPPSSPTRGLGIEDGKQATSRVGPANDPIAGLGPLGLADLATDQVLQEKLSHYTAVIESHLVREIGRRSSSFFSALSNLQSLHHQGDTTLAKIAELQTALAPDHSGVGGAAKRGLQVLRAQARRRGLETIERGVREVEELWNGVEAVKELVENGEWVGALEVSEQIEAEYYGSTAAGDSDKVSSSLSPSLTVSTTDNDSSLVATPSSKRRAAPNGAPTRLRYTRVKALQGLPRKLALLRSQVAKSLESELITVLEHEMEVGIADYRRLVVTGGWRRASSSSTATSTGGAPLPIGSGTTTLSPSFMSAFGITPPPSETTNGSIRELGEDHARESAMDRVRPVVRALVRADGMDAAIAAWRESVLKEIRRLVRANLPFSESPTQEQDDPLAQMTNRGPTSGKLGSTELSDKSATLAKRLRAMSHDAFLQLARETYLSMLGGLEIVDVHAHVLIELAKESREAERVRRSKRRGIEDTSLVVEDLPPKSSSMLAVPGSASETLKSPIRSDSITNEVTSPVDDSALYTDITDVVHGVAELANLRFSKVIGVRTEQHAQLSLESFVEIFDASWAFVLRCETLCQRMIVGLRGVMVGQAKTFLQAFHQKRLTNSARYVEEEQWSAADVPASTQHVVDLVVQSATADPGELLLGQRLVEVELKDGEAASKKMAEVENGEVKAAKQVDIEGRKYFAVSAGVLALDVLADYLKVVINCPLLTTDAMSKVVEFLKSFNSRTCQVVLGAGAMRSAGLKNITAKHLALASQALSIMISLVPYIRECLRRHLNPKQAILLVEFDKVKRDYQEHQNEIHSKLVAIMGDRLDVHARTLKSINWDDSPNVKENSGPNAYMESLVKEHITLHKVLSRFLHVETVEFIMRQVFAALDARLKAELGAIELKSEAAKRRMLSDVAHLRMRLGELKGLEEIIPGKELEGLVAIKNVPVPVVVAAPVPVEGKPMPPTPVESPKPPSPAPAPLPTSPAETPVTPVIEAAPVSAAPAPPSPVPAAVTNITSTEILSSPRTSLDSPRPSQDSPGLSSATSSPILNRAPPTTVPLHNDPPRRKSLAERLAEMARRGGATTPTTRSPTLAQSHSSPNMGLGLEKASEKRIEAGVIESIPEPENEVVVPAEVASTPVAVEPAPEVEKSVVEESTTEETAVDTMKAENPVAQDVKIEAEPSIKKDHAQVVEPVVVEGTKAVEEAPVESLSAAEGVAEEETAVAEEGDVKDDPSVASAVRVEVIVKAKDEVSKERTDGAAEAQSSSSVEVGSTTSVSTDPSAAARPPPAVIVDNDSLVLSEIDSVLATDIPEGAHLEVEDIDEEESSFL